MKPALATTHADAPPAAAPTPPQARACATAGLFTTNGNDYALFRPATAVTLPPETFILRAAPLRGFYLAKQENLQVPERIYGVRHETRIMRAYTERANQGISTGVWLDGEKGAGKTMFASVLSQEMRKLGYPTIMMQTPFTGPELNSVIEHIGQACFLFDEFEKVYDAEETQNALLTVFAGAVVAKNMYIVTTNSFSRVSFAMRNRPTRMRYFVEYRGVTADIVKEFVEHRMADRSKHADMILALKQVPNCNFDIMQCAVEEHNHFGGDVIELLTIMNISRRTESNWKVLFRGTINHHMVEGQQLKGVGSWRGDVEAKLSECRVDDNLESIRLRFEIEVPPEVKAKDDARASITEAVPKLLTIGSEPSDGKTPVRKTQMVKTHLDWNVYIDGTSKVTYEADGGINVTTSTEHMAGKGILTFRHPGGFNSCSQRF